MGPKRENEDHDKGESKRQKVGNGTGAAAGKNMEDMKARIEALKSRTNLKGLNTDKPSADRKGKPNGQDKRQASTSEEQRSQSSADSRPTRESALGDMDAMLAKIKERKAQAQAEKTNNGSNNNHRKQQQEGKGLNAPVHPLFLDQNKDSEQKSTKAKQLEKSQEDIRNNKYLEQPADQETTANENPYFDSSIISGKAEHKRKRGLVFNSKGKYIEQANQLRKQAQLDALKKKIEASSKKVGLEADLVAGEREFKPDKPPEAEWWDEEILNDLDNAVTDLIQHPIPISAPWEKQMPQDIKLHMTKKEYKRLRKNTRAEKHKEEQDRIRLGLDPAPPPKIKPSNVMSVYANEAIKDPTLMEQKAKKAVAERRQKHDEDNENRKLTPDQRYEKMMEKIEKEKDKGLYCAVFRIEKFVDGNHKYIVNYNANKSQFTGMVIFNPKFNLVVVEGGHLQIKKFTKLMINRIKWAEASAPRDGSPKPDLTGNQCRLVWHGELKQNKFNRWTLKDAETEQDAKDLLSRNDALGYWIEARSLD